jgi:hypothetical protein
VWLSVDPILKHHESPYSFTSNNPIMLVDPDGRDTTNAFDQDKNLKKTFDYVFSEVSSKTNKYDKRIKRLESKAMDEEGNMDYSKLSKSQLGRLEKNVGKWKKWNDIKSDFDAAIESDIQVTFNSYFSTNNAGETGWSNGGVLSQLEIRPNQFEEMANLIHEMSHVGELISARGPLNGSLRSENIAYKKQGTFMPSMIKQFIKENNGDGSLHKAVKNAYPQYR